jgi:polysaccharide export outer membrane protein
MLLKVFSAAWLLALAALTSSPTPAAAQSLAAPAAATSAASGAPAVTKNYVLGPGDVIELKVLGRSDFDNRARINQDGKIKILYLGEVQAKDKTAAQFEAELSRDLDAKGYFSHPIVKVEIVSFASRYAVVLGEVGAPGLVPIDRSYQLSEIIARVGGLRETGADYVFLRKASGLTTKVFLDALATGAAADDPAVEAGDKVFSPKAELFYMVGQIRNPGAFATTTDLNLRMAIGKAGGLTDLGTDRNARVFTRDGKARRLDLNEKISAGDVIVIGERLF